MDEILQLRRKVDKVDDQIILALCERVKVCEAIGVAKKKRGLPVRDASRENEVYKRIKEKSVQFQLDPAQIERVYREIVNICSAVQE
jgi:chorismate mutase